MNFAESPDANAPLFDALSGDIAPTLLFGELVLAPEASLALQKLLAVADEARSSITNIFNTSVSPDLAGVSALDSIIAAMWNQSWNPNVDQFNLFVTHFGALLADTALRVPNTQPVFRDLYSLNHFSLWQPNSQMEYFLFHKTAKVLRLSDGESLLQFYKAIVSTNVA